MKIGLGTVQFGVSYGVSNSSGKVSVKEVKNILEFASKKDIEILDTAALYGDSEEIIGKCLPRSSHFKCVTKTPVANGYLGELSYSDYVRNTFFESLKKLSMQRVYGLLVHHANDILGHYGDEICDCIKMLKEEGFVEKIGVSIYDAVQLDEILKRILPDIVQLPLNPFDQRLLKSGHLNKLKNLGIEVHVRSLFLQGLLLMDSSSLPVYFNPIANHFVRYHEFLDMHGFLKIQGALRFVMQQPDIDVALVGVTSENELQDIVSIIESDSGRSYIDFSSFAIDDEKFVNPARWEIN